MSKIKCRNCDRLRPSFCLGVDDCDKCRPEIARLKTQKIELAWEDIRARRNRLLEACNWTQLEDTPPATKERWKPYRDALRDIPQTFKNPSDVVWPKPPT